MLEEVLFGREQIPAGYFDFTKALLSIPNRLKLSVLSNPRLTTNRAFAVGFSLIDTQTMEFIGAIA